MPLVYCPLTPGLMIRYLSLWVLLWWSPQLGAQALPITATAADAGLSARDFGRAIELIEQAVAACQRGDHRALAHLSQGGPLPPDLSLPSGLVCYSLTPLAPQPGQPQPLWLVLLQLPPGTRAPAGWPLTGAHLRHLRVRSGQTLILEKPARYLGLLLLLSDKQVRLFWPD